VALRQTHLVVLAIGVTALLAACGGSSATKAPSAAATGVVAPASAGALSQPSAAPPAQAVSAAPSSAAQASAGDVANSASGLDNLSSYKLSMTTSGGSEDMTVTTVVVRKPAFAESVTESVGGHTIRMVISGSTLWLDEGTGTFVKAPLAASAIQSMTAGFNPALSLQQINKNGTLSVLKTVGVETKNGVQAIHLHGDHSTPIPAGQPTIPPGGTIDIWIATNGNYLVAMEWSGIAESGPTPSANFPTSAKWEITNINDPTLSVSVPS
jgi:hypothetical protein